MKSFLAMLLIVTFSSCVMYYDTNVVRNNMNGTNIKLIHTINHMSHFVQDYQNGYQFLMSTVEDTLEKPYPELASLLDQMRLHVDSLVSYRPLMMDVINDFEVIAKDKGRIESNKSEWEQMKPIKYKFTFHVDGINDVVNDANDISNNISEICKKNGIGKMSVADIKNQVTVYLEQMNTSPADSSKIHRKKESYSELLILMGDRSDIWVGPRSKISTILDEIKSTK